MTALDNALSITLGIILLVGVPFCIRAIPAISAGFMGQWDVVNTFWTSGWIQVMTVSLLVCIGLLITGVVYQ